jgi:plastocyanin
MRRQMHAIITGLLAIAAPAAAFAGQLAGRVETRVHEGGTPATAVVYAEPLDQAVPMRGGSVTVTQKNKSFVPRVIGVPAGTVVTFPNDDQIFHNVFSLSPPQPFDLGLYRSGASKARTFTLPAVYNIFCNIHPQMVAFLVVAPTPWITTTAADGSWRFELPTGRYRVTALSERSAPVSVEVRVGTQGGSPVVITLDESRGVQATHMNKFGKPYPPAAYKDK